VNNLLIGIPSHNVFELHPSLLQFGLNPSMTVNAFDSSSRHRPCMTPESLKQAVAELMEVGTLFMHLREFQ
jgi:hypothetical protein